MAYKLNYDQKLTLSLFTMFFGRKYEPSVNNKVQLHNNAQTMCYLLTFCGINIGNFSYSWHYQNPYSPGLLVLLREMDREKEAIEDYYEHEKDQPELLTKEQYETVKHMISVLDIKNYIVCREYWINVLACLAFLSNVEYPGEGFKSVVKELQRRTDLNDKKKNFRAWYTLKRADMLKAIESEQNG